MVTTRALKTKLLGSMLEPTGLSKLEAACKSTSAFSLASIILIVGECDGLLDVGDSVVGLCDGAVVGDHVGLLV